MKSEQELNKMIDKKWPLWLNSSKEVFQEAGRFLLDSGLQVDEAFDQLERLCEVAVYEGVVTL